MMALDVHKTAVIVLDVQNDFCDDRGAFAKFLGWKTESIKKIVPKLEIFIKRLREAGCLVVFSQMINDKEESPENLRMKLAGGAERGAQQWPFGLARGSWGWELYKLKSTENDVVLEKKYYDLFSNPKLNDVLRSRGIETIIVAGLYTEVCVFGTVERAFTEGYRVIVPSDLVGSIDERQQIQKASLEIMSNYLADVVESEYIRT